MPKIKTHKGTWSRIHMTGGGKLMRGKIGGSHLRRNKTPRTKRQYHGQIPIHPTVKARVKRLLPYGGAR